MLFRALIAAALSLALPGSAFAADPRRDEQWGLEMVEAQQAWPTSTGVGATVAVIDTGAQFDHPDLGGRLLPGYDFVGAKLISDTCPNENGKPDGDPSDGNGHGTHVAGIAVANRDNDEGIAGIAPGARVLPYRVLDNDGFGCPDDTIEAIRKAIDDGAHVINLSLGEDLPLSSTLFDSSAYENALQRAVEQGIVVVIAAGNDGLPQCQNPPVEEILCVGSVDSRGLRSAFSSFGSNVDLMAPGGSCAGGSEEDVLSAYIASRYESICGTSQATPHVAGVAALLVSLGLRGQEATDRILATAAPAGSSFEYGAGIVDAAAAVEGLAPPPPPDDPDDPPTATGSWSTADEVKRRAVRRRGFRVKCTAVRPGTCGVVVRHHGRRIARGGGDVPAAIETVVAAQLNRAGRKRLKRMGQRIRVRVAVTLPGEATRSRRITVRR